MQTLASYLTSKGYRIIFAQTGKEAVERTQKGHPDLILMDIQMPEMNGLEAIRQIREFERVNSSFDSAQDDRHSESCHPERNRRTQPATRTPIIALTALAMPGDWEKCLTSDTDEYISKPVSLQKLSEMIEKFLSNAVNRH